jgi:hypothetical protein
VLGQLDQAITHFRRAQSSSPSNITIAARLGSVLEARGSYLEALDIYLAHVIEWPRVFQLRYRLAATLAMSDQWLGTVRDQRIPAEVPRRVAENLRRRGDMLGKTSLYGRAAQQVSEPSLDDFHRALLEVAVAEWNDLLGYLTWWACLKRSAKSFALQSEQYRDFLYQRQLCTVRGERRDLRVLIRCALPVSRVQGLAPWPAPLGTTKEAVRRARDEATQLTNIGELPDDARYAIACLYGRLWEVAGDPADADRAVEQLRLIARGRSTGQWLATIDQDPDLEALRRTRAFHEWNEVTRPNETGWAADSWLLSTCRALADRWLTEHLIVGTKADEWSSTEIRSADQRLFTEVAATLTGTPDPKRSARMVADAAVLAVRLDQMPAGPASSNAGMPSAPLADRSLSSGNATTTLGERIQREAADPATGPGDGPNRRYLRWQHAQQLLQATARRS